MKVKLIYLALLIGLMLFIFSWFDVKSSASFEMMLSFMSITIGFSVTALSLVASSSFSKVLYGKSGKSNNKTQLHDLIDLFKQANSLFLLNIMLIFFHSWFSQDWLKSVSVSVKGVVLNLSHLFGAIVWGLLILSIIVFFELFNMFCSYIIQEAKKT